jgi:hypothetical protein
MNQTLKHIQNINSTKQNASNKHFVFSLFRSIEMILRVSQSLLRTPHPPKKQISK